MNALGWIFTILSTLSALWGLVRLRQVLNQRIAAGTFSPQYRTPALVAGACVGFVFVLVAVSIGAAVTSGLI